MNRVRFLNMPGRVWLVAFFIALAVTAGGILIPPFFGESISNGVLIFADVLIPIVAWFFWDHVLPRRLAFNEYAGYCDVCHWHGTVGEETQVAETHKRLSPSCRVRPEGLTVLNGVHGWYITELPAWSQWKVRKQLQALRNSRKV